MRLLTFLRDFLGLLGLLAMLYGWTAVLGSMMAPEPSAPAVATKKAGSPGTLPRPAETRYAARIGGRV
jgi:hypothetical protein